MIRFFPLLLAASSSLSFREADKGGGAGGAAEQTAEEKAGADKAAADKAAADKVAADKVDPAQPAKLTVFQKAGAMLKDKSELLAIIAARDATITDLRSQIAIAAGKLMEQDLQLAGMKELEAAVAALEAGKKTTEAAVIDKVAALGFPAKNLPAATSAEAQDGDAPTSIADFNKRHGEMTQKDPAAASKFYNQYAKKFGL